MKTNFFLLSALLLLIFSSCKKEGDSVFDFNMQELAIITSGDANELMRVYNYFDYSDSLVLRSYSSNISDFNDPYLTLLMNRMLITVKDPQHPGVGLAAPQVGINKRVIWVKRYDTQGYPFVCYLNARINQYSDTVKLRPDGCLSIPGVSESSYRAIWVDIEYDLPDGTHHTERITHEYTAHIFQHEIDHLNGVVFLDRLVQQRQSNYTILPYQDEWFVE